LRGKLSENLVYGVVQTNYPSKKLSLDMKKQNWENTLHIMADLYVKGEVVDFDKLYEGRHCIKVLLPNYPFQRKEYWLEDTEAKTTEFSDVGTGLGKENTREGMINYLTGLIRNALSFGDETVDIHQPLLELGIDSITALQLNNT
jgi:acyl transferase domain-containing protein